MRHESSVTSISWIPSEAVKGPMKLPFETGMAHYDNAPPDVIEDLEALRRADRFRFANELRAYVEVEDGRITGHGHLGGGRIGETRVQMGPKSMVFTAFPFPDLRPQPEVSEGSVRFVQTAGGRTGAPAPRRVKKKPFIQFDAPSAWTTLSLTIHADGSSEHELLGASPFPRHWVYQDGKLAAKSGMIDFERWYREAFGENSPWGDKDSPALVTAVETALERELANNIMQGDAKPDIRKLRKGKTLTEQGDVGDELFLLLDGVLEVEVDGKVLADVGPGAILGERAVLEAAVRTSTLRAMTHCKVAAVPAAAVDRDKLAEVATGHHREEE